MESAMKSGSQGWMWAAQLLVVALGVAFCVAGVVQGDAHFIFGGAMFLVMAGAGVLHGLALRPGRDGNVPSAAEHSAWQQIGVGLAAVLVLGGIPLGSMHGKFSSWLLLGAYALIVAFMPAFRRRFIEENRRWRGVAEDERDRAIRARGDCLAKRLLELCLVAVVLMWALLPGAIQALDDPLHGAALLLLPVLAANTVGEVHVAWLYWRDRQ